MKAPRVLMMLVTLCGGLSAVSCTSTSTARALNNEQSRQEQLRAGYTDREDSKQQKKDEERAFQEELKRKSR